VCNKDDTDWTLLENSLFLSRTENEKIRIPSNVGSSFNGNARHPVSPMIENTSLLVLYSKFISPCTENMTLIVRTQ
jgi:hypothetical protein